MRQSNRSVSGRHAALAVGVIATAALVLLLTGRTPICTCGSVGAA